MECPVATSGFSAFRSRIESPALQAIADHWDEARGGGKMPSWGDIRPSCIAPHLTRVWSFKYDRATGAFTARLAGNQITMGFGVSFRGTPLKEIYPQRSFQEVQARLERLVLAPCFYRSSGRLFRINGYVGKASGLYCPWLLMGRMATVRWERLTISPRR